MKQVLLCASITFLSLTLSAQILNNSFESWTADTLLGGGILSGDIFWEDPDNWGTANSTTQDPALGGFSQARKDTSANTGNFSVQLETERIVIQTFGIDVNAPGVVTNGSITLDINQLLTGEIDFESMITGGKPIGSNTRPATLDGFYTFAPVSVDTFGVIVSLTRWDATENEQEQVGGGFFQGSVATSTFTAFSVDLEYISCNDPDSVLIVVLSSASQDGEDGTLMNVDDVSFNGTAVGVAPNLGEDSASTNMDVAVNIDVLTNDSDCDGVIQTVTIETAPQNGAAVVEANNTITYTPATGFVGEDEFEYEACDDDGECNPFGFVTVTVDSVSSGVITIRQEIKVAVHPNPVVDIVNFEIADVPGDVEITIMDLNGQVISNSKMENGRYQENVKAFADGVYIYTLSQNGNVVSTGKFEKVR